MRPPRGLSVITGAGIYKIPCRECTEVFKGETRRDFKVRLGNHKTAVARNKVKYAAYQHVIKQIHPVDWKIHL